MMDDPDVVIIGAGADGSAAGARLAREHDLDVLLLEAGPFHGNEKWPDPHEDPGATTSEDPEDLDGKLYDEQLTLREAQSNDPTWGKLRAGPADYTRAPWFRAFYQQIFVYQMSEVGGTSVHYYGNHPRAYPIAINDQSHWPIDYEDLVPYFRLNEEVTDTQQAPVTNKEEVFIEGATNAGYDLIDDLNVTETGWRPQPNAISAPPEYLDSEYEGGFSYEDDNFRGYPLTGHQGQGGPHPIDAPMREKSHKGANRSWIPRALDANENQSMGNVAIRPNTYVTDIQTDNNPGPIEATGVAFRDTWTGETGQVSADVVVLAAGCVESPRLWLNADLPDDGWVGKGLTSHWFDYVVGTYPEETLKNITGQSRMTPYIGHNSGARFDNPGVGALEDTGPPPGLASFVQFLFSKAGYSFDVSVDPDEPWNTRGYISGTELKRKMAKYQQNKGILIKTDDRPRQMNGISLDDTFSDEHGPVPKVHWKAHPDDDERRDKMARIAAEIHQEAGAEHVHRCDWPPLLIHMQSSLAMGKVIDENCEAFNIDRLFVADHSALANGLGGPNPTNSGQALALRTADRIGDIYF